MDLWQLVRSGEGRRCINKGRDEAWGTRLMKDLADRRLGGMTLAYSIRLVRVVDGEILDHVPGDFFSSGEHDPKRAQYEREVIAQRDFSTRARTSSRFAGVAWLRSEGDGEIEPLGSDVVYLDAEGTVMLIVSCAGLAPISNELHAKLATAHIMHRVQLLLQSVV
jgi:hypothetical protein